MSDRALPRVTILTHPKKGTAWAVYLADELVCYRTKGRRPDIEKQVLPALIAAGHLPARFEYESYEAFSPDVAYVDANGEWPETAALVPGNGDAMGVRRWAEDVPSGSFSEVLKDLSFPMGRK